MKKIKEVLETIYTDFEAQQIALENPNSFWSKFFMAPFKRVTGKAKRKEKVYTFAEKRILVEKRNKKKISRKKRK
jgi:hypothetical protein